MIIKFFILILIELLTCNVLATTEILNPDKIINQIIQHYNNKQYTQSLKLLESIKEIRDSNINWYYYYALNSTRLGQYDAALVNFEKFVQNADVSGVATARAYYYIGLIKFQKGEYEPALVSLEVSLDISADPQLDSMTDILIDKTIRYQNYFENSKKTNVTFLFGYNLDANVLNLSQESFADNLNGSALGYGVSLSHKFIDKYKFVFEPTVAILDNYTLDSQFKANSVLQSTDALQVLISAPIRFFFEEDKRSNKYDISLNAYGVYLPVITTTRELSLTSVFLKTQILTAMSADFTIKYNLTLAADKAYGYATDDDNSSGSRGEFLVVFTHYLAKQNINNLFYDFGADYNAANGINSRFKKISASIGYVYPSFSETVSTVKIGYNSLNYPDKYEPRTDTQGNFTYNIMKSFASGASLGLSIGALSNSSNVALNKYNEVTAGFQYTKSFGF